MKASNAALLIIDMQTSLVTGAHRAREVTGRIAALAERMRAADRAVIYIQHNHASFAPMMKGAPGWNIHSDLTPQPGDIVLEKEASDAFDQTALESTLRRLNVDTVLITGMQTEYCVDTTARSALVRGFDVILVSDCHTTGDATLSAQQIIEHHNATLPNVVHPTRTITAEPGNMIELAYPQR